MKKIVFTLLIFGLAIQFHAQTIDLPTTLVSVNYKYLNATDSEITPQPVEKLKDAVLNYRTSELTKLYDDENDIYKVSFSIPEGEIIAAYNKKGAVVRTTETYNNVRLPLVVMQAISKRFPNWGIVKGIYLVKYQGKKDLFHQEYKVKIKNEDEVITVMTDENGLFI
ncbi:nicotinate-nucleotide adenylyltransferase [Mariniflexile sp.]|uniref:nicotinate-nucleotide adenylyltransferase n=1 Tax=Mariniflexile sp. TaxID=1979402 RepID=UPI0040472360